MSSDLYEKPRPILCQGDIFELLPHARLDAPLLKLEKPEGAEYFVASGEPFSTFNDKNGQDVISTCRRRRAMLLSHDCEIEKKNVTKWQICPVIEIQKITGENMQGKVRGNRVYSMFHLPKHWDVLPESYVDFNHISLVDSSFIKGAKKIATLSDVGRMALYHQFIRWLTRWELHEIPCPSCSTYFDPTMVLPVRPAE